ncbi:MAG: hypothetical protein NC338_08450 [Firmicutes bacterium]|nr:hypothetical protein [Bacillota bacterium]MCM1402167.1 hypothetical protein [Bacteroides sp.]MCM1476541.1 hypothetical protein [Bacteroides sp.]
MVYKFRIVSDEVENFRREIEIDADSTFLALRNAICDSVGFDKNQLSSFFICDDGWEKDVEITLEDMGSDASEDVYLMEDSVISDFVEDEGQRLLYVFDYMTDRCFFMELRDTEPGKSLLDPVCTVARGKAPAQTVEPEEFIEKTVTKTDVSTPDIDEEFYGSSEYNPDEFDAEGFDEMTFEE